MSASATQGGHDYIWSALLHRADHKKELKQKKSTLYAGASASWSSAHRGST